MKILLIEGTPFIGPRVVSEFHTRGHEVPIFHRGEREHASIATDVRHFHGDLTTGLASRGSDFESECVIHMVPMNGEDMSVVMKGFFGRTGRVVAISSVDVYLAYDISRGKEPDPALRFPLSGIRAGRVAGCTTRVKKKRCPRLIGSRF